MAANDINLNAAQMHNQSQNGSTILDAGHDINLSTVNTSNAISTGHRKNYIKREETQDIGTQIRTQGDVSLSAGNDANLKAANINNENGKLTIQADNDINLTTGKVIDPCWKKDTFLSYKMTKRKSLECAGNHMNITQRNLRQKPLN